MQVPRPPEQMKVEKWFAGTWNCKGQQHAGPTGPERAVTTRLTMKMERGRRQDGLRRRRHDGRAEDDRARPSPARATPMIEETCTRGAPVAAAPVAPKR
jgi:hypothetical protein